MIVVLLLTASYQVHADLREELGEVDFERAGLHKLSVEELAVLQTLLAVREDRVREQVVEEKVATGELLRAETMPQGDDRFGLETVTKRVQEFFSTADQDEISSRITGKFRGWSGNTVFRLENGQVWRQSARGNFVVNLEDPEVTIRRGRFGGYLLKVEGYGSTVRVTRVE
jgi:hypothetical protein